MPTVEVSVIIPVLNGAGTLKRCLDSVLRQQPAALEVIVVDDGSTDTTREVIAGYGERITALRNERNLGIARSCNLAIARASGEIVLFLAADCALVHGDHLAAAAARLDDPSVGAVTGRALMPNLAELPRRHRVFARLNLLDVNRPASGVREVNFVELRCDAFRRGTLVELGMLDERLHGSNEDQDISLRMMAAGFRLLQDDDLEFELQFGDAGGSTARLIRKQLDYGFGQAFILTAHGVSVPTALLDNPNRRARALHRVGQASLLPLSAAATLGATRWPSAAYLLGALLVWRVLHAVRLSAALPAADRAVATLLGLCCDVVYSAAFLVGVTVWSVRHLTGYRASAYP